MEHFCEYCDRELVYEDSPEKYIHQETALALEDYGLALCEKCYIEKSGDQENIEFHSAYADYRKSVGF
jgi:hypothetical protein